jgi:hypothetical protein
MRLAIQVERRIYFLRGEKVMLDYDLAAPLGCRTHKNRLIWRF